VPLAYLPPSRPAQHRRPVDEGDALHLWFGAHPQPDPYRVPHGLDRVAVAHGRHLMREPRGDVGLDGVQGRLEQRHLVRELVVQRPPGDPRRRRDRVGRHLSEAVRGEQPARRRYQRVTGRGRPIGLGAARPGTGGSR